jgi:hypothetical protein
MYCTYENFNSLSHKGKLLCPTSIPWSSHVGYLLYHGVGEKLEKALISAKKYQTYH